MKATLVGKVMSAGRIVRDGEVIDGLIVGIPCEALRQLPGNPLFADVAVHFGVGELESLEILRKRIDTLLMIGARLARCSDYDSQRERLAAAWFRAEKEAKS